MGVVILVQCAGKDAPCRCVALPLYGLQKEASHPLCESREAAQPPPPAQDQAACSSSVLRTGAWESVTLKAYPSLVNGQIYVEHLGGWAVTKLKAVFSETPR